MINARGGVVEVDRPAGLRQPHLDAVSLQLRDDAQGLVSGEGTLVLADHDGIEIAVGSAGVVQELRGGGSLAPGQAAAVAGVDVLGHDTAVPSGQPNGVVVLPPP
jgi:hypothetical protein